MRRAYTYQGIGRYAFPPLRIFAIRCPIASEWDLRIYRDGGRPVEKRFEEIPSIRCRRLTMRDGGD